MNEKTNDTNQQPKKPGALSLLKKLFEENGAVLETLEDGRFGFTYGNGDDQGEFLVVEADDDHLNIRVADYCWYEVSKWDTEKVAKIQSNINLLNMFGRYKVVYHFDDSDMMKVSTLVTFPMYPEISDMKAYFTAQIQSLMSAHALKATDVKEGGEE